MRQGARLVKPGEQNGAPEQGGMLPYYLCRILAHCSIALRVEVEPVVGIVGAQALRIGRVTDEGVEVDQPVEVARLADPLVDSLPHGLVEIRVPTVAFRRRDRSPVDFDVFGVGFIDQRLISVDDLLHHLFIVATAAADVVGTFEDDELRDIWLGENVAVEALERRFAQSAAHDTVATDAQVEHADAFLTAVGCALAELCGLLLFVATLVFAGLCRLLLFVAFLAFAADSDSVERIGEEVGPAVLQVRR